MSLCQAKVNNVLSLIFNGVLLGAPLAACAGANKCSADFFFFFYKGRMACVSASHYNSL